MNRTFTFLLALFFSVTMSAQRSTADYPKTPESPAAKFQKEFLKQLNKPGQLRKPESAETIEHEFHVKAGRPYSELDDLQAARSEPLAFKKRLDSIVGEKTKVVYEYDENDNHVLTIEYIKDSITGLWKPSLKDESSYDENGRISMDAAYHYDDSLKQWIGDWRTDYTRDENGRITVYVDYDWETNDDGWIFSERWEYSYTENGLRATFTLYEWDADLEEWVGIYTEQWNYDENGNATSSSSSWEWDPVGKQFKPGFKMEFTRNDSGQVLSWVESRYDPGLGDWVYTERGDNTYDENGNPTQQVWSSYDTISGQFNPTSKYDNTFDADGDQLSSISAFYNLDSMRWENSQKWEYIYQNTKSVSSTVSVNAGKVHVTTIVYLWYPFPLPGVFVPLYRTVWTYNSEGQITKVLDSNYDQIAKIWEETQQEISEYNARGYLILQVQSMFDKESNTWIVTSRRVHVYDANGVNLSNALYLWSYLHNVLIGYYYNVYTRDEHVNVLSITEHSWDLASETWLEYLSAVYTYNYNFSGFDILAPFYMWHMISTLIEYEYFVGGGTTKSSEEWVQTEAFTYHYSDMNVGVSVADLSKGELSIYPNPATEYIEIAGDELNGYARIMMYNISGRMVMNQVLDRGGRIPVSHLSEGIYVIRLTQGSKVKTAKVMIQ